MNENKSIDLTGIMYNQDGTFIPRTGNTGNIDGELAHLRDTYMEAEREYFEYLLANPGLREEFIKLLNKHPDNLFETAMELQEKLETGDLETYEERIYMQSLDSEARDKYHMQKLEKVEGMLCLLLAAARDKARILELVYTKEEASSYGRSR